MDQASQWGPAPIVGSYWVQDGFIAGEYPGGWARYEGQARLRKLLQAGVTFFLDLTERGEKDLQPYAGLLYREARTLGSPVDYRRMPIPDYDTPTVAQMRQILNVLDAALAAGHRVYVHCYAGVGRTGTVVGCFLVRHGWSGHAALDQIVELRRGLDPKAPPSPITGEQRALVRAWANDDRVR
jgi:protein-tyrosine phosphatase